MEPVTLRFRTKVPFCLVWIGFLPLVGGAAAAVLTLGTAVHENSTGVADRVAVLQGSAVWQVKGNCAI